MCVHMYVGYATVHAFSCLLSSYDCVGKEDKAFSYFGVCACTHPITLANAHVHLYVRVCENCVYVDVGC